MKTKRFVILVCMLMIVTSISFLADANETLNDNQTIHFIQFPISTKGNVYVTYEKHLVPQSYIPLNDPPLTPSQPSGSTNVIVGNWYLYTTVTTDPVRHYICYGWDEGDGIVNYWTGYYPSGEVCMVYIKFLSVGTYKLQVKARDQYGAESAFSQPLYVSATGSSTNHPPNVPSNPNPLNQATDVDITNDLSWTGGDPDPGDSVSYDMYFGSMLPLPKVASNISTTTYNPGFLFNSLTYYWFVVAWDNHGWSTQGPMWHFTTIGTSNTPPVKPTIAGPSTGKIGRSYTFSTTTIDPETDVLYYLFDWADGTDSGWIGPYNSGDICQASHIWTTRGSYAVKVKAKDIHEEESFWSDPLQISMPKMQSYNPIIQLFSKIPERFQFLYSLFIS